MIKNKKGTWKFDSKNAENFYQIAKTNIPDYKKVIKLTVEIADKFLNNESKILDIGSALGYTLECFYNKGYLNLYGVDSSEEMIKRSFSKATLINSKNFPVSYGKFNYIIANWTLHFILDRENYLKSIYDNLEEGGYFFITEKTSSSSICKELYYDFKRSNGLSEKQILNKELALEGILVTNSLDWYISIFKKIGFSSIDIVNVFPSFYSFLLKK